MEKASRLPLLSEELLNLVWGPMIKHDIFTRWSQGFFFSDHERTALVQCHGGPCAILAPVQAILLKNLINIYDCSHIRELDTATIDRYLCLSLVELLCQCSQECDESKSSQGENMSAAESPSSNIQCEGPFRMACFDDSLPTAHEDDMSTSPRHCPTNVAKDPALFHHAVRLRIFEKKYDLEEYLESNVQKLKEPFGILLFLYSVILTRGVERVKLEMGDESQSLIEPTAGHGSQALTNLLICGRAVSYVWDGDKHVGGLKLSGVVRRPKVGFLTQMEHLHYVQVGWYLKNPLNPVWILGSESHLTVLFSWTLNLVTPDSERERANKVLSWFDADGNKFFAKNHLKDILAKLSLCTEPEFIEFMEKELDPENVGVILFNKFLEVFFDSDADYKPPDTFNVFHYNGLESSCPENKARYTEGIITLQEDPIEYSVRSDILSCLRTKWGNVDAIWKDFPPSLN